MKPVIILTPDQMCESDIDLLKENGFCVVVAKKPYAVRFLDPIPASSSRTEIEAAALRTMDWFLSSVDIHRSYNPNEIKARFVKDLLEVNGEKANGEVKV